MRSDQLRKLCTPSEYKLLQSASPRAIGKLTPAKLKATQTKVQSLATRLKGQSKSAPKAEAAGVKAKAAAFAAAGKRLEVAGAKLSRAAAKAAKSRTRAAPRKKTAKKKPTLRVSTRGSKAAKRGGVKKAAAPRRSATATGRAGAPSRASRARPAGPSASRPVANESAEAAPISRNPLTHKGTRASRTQLLLEHQAAPAPTDHNGAAPITAPPQGSNLGELIHSTEVRNQTLATLSEESRGPRVDNLFASAANARIRGHASGAGRRAQGRRDAQQRGDKRQDMGNVDG